MATRSVLVVDDDRMIHTMMRGALEKHGFRVHSAFDSVQAPAVARQVNPDVIVLDITMPGGGGFEAFRRLQMIGTTAAIPVLVYTSMPSAEVTRQIQAGPSVGILIKPASPDDILAAVETLLPPSS